MSTFVTIVLGVIAAGITLGAAYVVWKTGAAKGWRETAEAFKARSEEQATTIAENATAIANAETRITRLTEDLVGARERIAVLEDRPDLSVVVAGLQALTDAESSRHDVHEARALERHEGIVSALTALTLRLT
jgi:hypothetical protein